MIIPCVPNPSTSSFPSTTGLSPHPALSSSSNSMGHNIAPVSLHDSKIPTTISQKNKTLILTTLTIWNRNFTHPTSLAAAQFASQT